MGLLPYELSLIAAYMGRQRILGLEGDMPWPRIQTDMEVFRAMTCNALVVMGRVTWESIIRRNGHPLLGRTSIVLTREDPPAEAEYIPAFSVEDALAVVERCRIEGQKVCVVGGAQIYQAFMPYASRIFISRIVHRYGRLPRGDTFFPCFNKKEFPVHRRKSSGWDGRYRVVLEERIRVGRV